MGAVPPYLTPAGGDMRRVTLGDTGIETSCLGFGCAALGSRIAPEVGARALAAAHAGGVTWFDLAPVYGGGRAEEIAAPYLRAHRAEVQICTKAGLALAGGAGRLRRVATPLARRVLKRPLAAWLGRVAPAANVKLALTPDLITGSLEASLKRLGTDYVDLFALHAPTPAEVARDDILRALEAIVAAGKARAVGVADDVGAAAAAAGYGVVQLPLPPPGADVGALAAIRATGRGVIVHSVFGADATLARRMADDEGLKARARAAGRGDLDRGLGRLLIERAFALNPDGVVLAAMTSEASRAANLAAAAVAPAADPLSVLRRGGDAPCPPGHGWRAAKDTPQ
jgi:aryl-alcohol dehydrogenase-like predicted oxidoreductase